MFQTEDDEILVKWRLDLTIQDTTRLKQVILLSLKPP
jgi:hypothetical protein